MNGEIQTTTWHKIGNGAYEIRLAPRVSVRDAMKILGTSRQTVHRLIGEGKLKVTRPARCKMWIAADSLVRHLSACCEDGYWKGKE